MAIDYIPPQPVSAYIAYVKAEATSPTAQPSIPVLPTVDFETTTNVTNQGNAPSAPVPLQNNGALTGTANYSLDAIFNPKAIWGPIGGRMLPSTKKSLSKVLSRNISDLSEAEYEDLRYLIEYIATNPQSKQRVFELTGFNDNDLAFAEKYFRRYDSRRMFSKLVEFALATSSNGKVSKQVSGLVQFIFETGEINGRKVSHEYKYKLLRGIPELLSPVWAQVASDCNQQSGLCQSGNNVFLDLNEDRAVNSDDVKIALSSLDWLREQSN